MTAQFGPHRFSAGEYDSDHTDQYRGANFTVHDLTGSRFVDCDLTDVKIVDGVLVNVDISGYVQHLVVNGIDVTDYVSTELHRRHPERARLGELRGADDFKALWSTVEDLWSGTIKRAERLPEEVRHERVDGEWSIAETLRHLIFITDAWVSRTVLDEPRPYHPIGLPQSWYPQADAAALGIDVNAAPTWTEVLEALDSRRAVVRTIMVDLKDADLGRLCDRPPAPGYPEGDRPVAECLAVLLEEEIEHHRYAVRDLQALEAR
ncbi:DinB family protein [Kribbella amoyensis]|uniref:DinB family protein n=1 Tax=Kribbella amoyensis TaxID=996641 RepID=A0A561BJG3_9ACTN|nr:DinB family protein [Kribbella amoyensis]TWD79018.1 DinB family protein [Kribbella amoyensis]